MLWLPWTQFTWAANAVSAHARNVQIIVLIATVASVPMAASLSTALGDGGWLFAGSVVVILAMGLVLLIMANPVGSPEWRSAVIYAIPNVIAMVLFVSGAAFSDECTRIGTWVVAILIIAYGTIKAGRGEWVVRAGHISERHALIVIIALGEIIVAIAVPVLDALSDDDGLPAETTASLIFAGLFAALLWWAYFDRPQKLLERRLKELQGPARAQYARDVYTYMHSLIVGGVIMSAAALEEITLHPSAELHLEFRVMLLIGLGMFFGAVELSALRSFHVIPPERGMAIAALAALLLAGGSLSGIWLLVAIDALILVTLGVEARRLEHPHETSPIS